MLYEDDFEFEEQPANIRDRAIPGKGGGGGGGGRGSGSGGRGGGGRRRNEPPGGGRRYGPPRRSGHSAAGQEVPQEALPARDLLREILERMGVGPIDIAYIPRAEGEYLEVSGPELGMLIGRHGNTLEALNLVFNNI